MVDIARQITAEDTQNPFSVPKAKISAGQDASILFCADSNANNSNEFVYVFAQYLAALYPTHSVIYNLWVEDGAAWNAAVTIQTGSTSAVINIWNAANPGVRPDYFLGTRYFLSHQMAGPDAICLYHGGNMYVGVPDAGIAGMYYEYFGKVAEAFPGAGFVVFKGQPERDTNAKDALFAAFDRVAARVPALILDVYAIIQGRGKTSDLFNADGVHLSDLGQQIGPIALIQQAWARAGKNSAAPISQWSRSSGTNLIGNGNFAEFASSLPSSPNGTFGVRGNAAIGKSTAIYHPKNPNKYSLTVTGDGSTASPALRWTPDASTLAAIKGKTVTMAARVFVPTGVAGDTTRARISLQQTNGSVTSIPRETDQGEWVWRVLSGVKIAADTSFVFLHVTGDDGGAADRITYVDQVSLTVGDYPVPA